MEKLFYSASLSTSSSLDHQNETRCFNERQSLRKNKTFDEKCNHKSLVVATASSTVATVNYRLVLKINFSYSDDVNFTA